MHVREAPPVAGPATVHSRSILAGYDPERLHAAHVAVIGLGALGQNLVQDLALSGIGQLTLVDFDDFEAHNATRSPFFPTTYETASLGSSKAAVVSAGVARAATAPSAEVRFAGEMVQQAGDSVVRWADVVVSAVDSVVARAWIAERCRVHGTPMIEGGFSGPEYNFSAFSPEPDAACYRCFNPARESAASCRQHARQAEALSIIPAIQTTAAVVGGLMAELTIQTLLGEYDYGRRIYGNVRTHENHTAILQTDTTCPGRHAGLDPIAELDAIPQNLRELANQIADLVGPGWISLAEPAILAHACTNCQCMCRVQSPESVWLRAPRCADHCGGPWSLSVGEPPQAVSMIPLGESLSRLAASTELRALGIRKGGSVDILLESGKELLVLMPGQPSESWSLASTSAV